PSVRLKRSRKNRDRWHIDDPTFQNNQRLMHVLATSDEDFAYGIIGHLAHASYLNSEDDLNFMFSVIKGIEARDPLEVMLAAQMPAVHTAAMMYAKHLKETTNNIEWALAERTVTKLTKTFVAQMEALKRHRTGGEQKVTVQHVSVGEGGQAIV